MEFVENKRSCSCGSGKCDNNGCDGNCNCSKSEAIKTDYKSNYINEEPHIKVRAKAVSDGRWVFGHYLEIFEPENTDGCIQSLVQTFAHATDDDECYEVVNRFIRVIPETVCTCLELTDSKNVSAYTRDIVIDTLNRKWIIFTCKGGTGICRNTEYINFSDDYNPQSSYPMPYSGLSEYQNSKWFSENNTIIGNLYDNPELLEEDEDIDSKE